MCFLCYGQVKTIKNYISSCFLILVRSYQLWLFFVLSIAYTILSRTSQKSVNSSKGIIISTNNQGDHLMFYLFVLIILFYVLYNIRFIFKRWKILFPIKFVYTRIYFKRTMQFGFLFFLAYIMGAVQPWLYEENFSDLDSIHGTLKIKWGGKSNDYYIKRFDGTESKIKFNLANLQLEKGQDSYVGEDVVVRHKMRYVYQMESDRGEIIFSIESANRFVCVHNLFQGVLYLFFIVGWIAAVLRSISQKKVR